MNDAKNRDARVAAIPDTHGHAKGEHKAYAEERPIPYSARMLFLWFYHACRRGFPRFMMVTDHMNYLTFEDPAAVNLVRRALKLAQAGDLYGAAETASVDVVHAAAVSDGLRHGMRFSIGAELDNDPRSRPDAQNIVDAMRPDAMLRAVHFITVDHPTSGPNFSWNFDNPEFATLYDHVGTARTWQLYMDALLKAVEEMPGHIVAHFYVPAKFGHWPDRATLEKYEDQIVAAAKAKGMAIEFNTRFLYRDNSPEEKQKYLEANKRLARKCRDAGVLIAIGADAHSPRDQGGAFDIVLQVLDDLEINEIAFPVDGRMARVALRVVQPEPPPAPEPEKRVRVGAGRKTPTPARPVRSSPVRKEVSAAAIKPKAASAKLKPAPPPPKAVAKKPIAKKPPAKIAAPKKAVPAKKRPPPPAKKAPVKKAAPAKKRLVKKVAPKRTQSVKKATKKAGKRR
ncbi:MAG: hypothetical protein ACRENA_02085 [Vulcanimicrobiaceae bacterium]